MKNSTRLLSILIITMMISTPFMSFATEEGSFDASDNSGGATTTEGEANKNDTTEAGAATDDSSADDTEAVSQDEAASVPDDKDIDNTEKDTDKLPDEPTEVTVVDSVVELSEESDAAYDNDAFFTIDAAKDDSADLATDEVSESVTDILSGDGSTTKKQSEIVDALEDSGLYRAEESGKSKVDVTSKFAYQRLRLIASQEAEINAYGATKAVYFEDSYLLSYDSIEATNQAYDAFVSDYGSEAVFIDTPMKLSAGEKGWGTAYMRMNHQKTLEVNSGEVTVAVVDSGIQKNHPVFNGTTILQGRDFINNDNDPADDEGHGTAVSGVIAESTPANVKILPLKAMDAKGEGSEFNVISAVRYAEEQGADIINLSIGGYLDSNSKMENYDAEFSNYNALIVCASGNENQNMDAQGVYEFPGELSSTVCVGAITAGKARSSFSNYGQAVDFAAPGSSIMIAKPGGSYNFESGTSFASPYIAAAAATVKAGHTDYSKAQMINYLMTISEDMGDAGKDIYFGNGCPRFPADPDHQRGGNISDQDLDTSVTCIQNKTYNGSEQTQDPCVIVNGEVLEKGTDFDIQYQNNVNAGTASMTIIGKGDYSGEIGGITFTIYPKSITPSVTLSGTSFTYTGKEIKPAVTVRDGSKVLTSGIDYTVNYSNNVNAGTGYAKVSCKGNYNGTNSASFRIAKNNSTYKLTAGDAVAVTPHTARIVWKMSHRLQEGDSVYSNDQKITNLKDNGDGTYSFYTTGLRPGRRASRVVKIVDKNGQTISNVLTISFNVPLYNLSKGDAVAVTPHTARIVWKMNFQIQNGDSLYVNGQKITNYKVDSNGTYSCNLTGLRASYRHTYPVKIVDKDGLIASNALNIVFNTPYTLSKGDAVAVTPHTARIVWKMSHRLQEGDSVYSNGQKITNLKDNGDGTYSFYTTGLRPGRRASRVVKIVDKNGQTISNVLTISFNVPLYNLSKGDAVAVTPHTARIVWKMNFQIQNGDSLYVNGQKITNYKVDSNGTYSCNLTGLRASYRHTYPVKIVDKDGLIASNALNIVFNTR